MKTLELKNLKKATVREIIRVLKDNGWYELPQKKHRQFAHPLHTNRLFLPATREGDTFPNGLIQGILKKAGLLNPY